MTDADGGSGRNSARRRADARRNEQTLLDAAAALFGTAGVDVPVRDIAARAGVGTGTIYRHFPTRADLIIAVYRHRIRTCADAGPALLATTASPHDALGRWVNILVDFLAGHRGLAAALRSADPNYAALPGYVFDLLVPVCAGLLAASARAGETRPDADAYELVRAVANLCIGAGDDARYDARRMVELLVTGLRRPPSHPPRETERWSDRPEQVT